jgi:hypothetical protein
MQTRGEHRDGIAEVGHMSLALHRYCHRGMAGGFGGDRRW